jgi:uncharacterized protein with ParB-like and HNH nuclease domain
MAQDLELQIDKAQQLVRTDSLQMSIGELATMYENGELVINPEFQRLFRWELEQKARLIESILLGIPVPSIFVFEMDDGTWELIDGLQRLSSIFEFMGILRDPDTKELLVPSALISTRYLKALNNAVWQKNSAIIDPKISDQIELDKKFQLSIRRSRLNVQVLKRPSDSLTKFELFQRLNAGGTQANAQELRNSIVIMLDRNFSVMMRKLAEHPSFAEIIEVSADAKEKQKDMEYVSRFIVYTYVKYDGTLDIEEFIDEGLMQTIKSNKRSTIERDFVDTFDFLFEACGSDALRRFDGKKFGGRVGYTAFEMIAVGVAQNIKAIRANPKRKDFIAAKIKELWNKKIPEDLVYGGMRGTTRISRTLPNGADWFK